MNLCFVLMMWICMLSVGVGGVGNAKQNHNDDLDVDDVAGHPCVTLDPCECRTATRRWEQWEAARKPGRREKCYLSDYSDCRVVAFTEEKYLPQWCASSQCQVPPADSGRLKPICWPSGTSRHFDSKVPILVFVAVQFATLFSNII